MTETQSARWEEIKRGFVRLQRLGGSEGDAAGRVMAELSVMSDRISEVARAIGSVSLPEALTPLTTVAATPPPSDAVDLRPWLQKLDETLLALRELHAARLPIAAASPVPLQQESVLSREAFLMQDTLIPLLRFMAHRFRSYRSIADPRVKQAISKLEQVNDLTSLAAALENISASALAKLTDERP